MRHLLVDLLHIFVIFMIALFIIGGVLAAMGTFDHWGDRYNLKRRRRRLRRQRDRTGNPANGKVNNTDNSNNNSNILSYASSNPDKITVTYQSKYA